MKSTITLIALCIALLLAACASAANAPPATNLHFVATANPITHALDLANPAIANKPVDPAVHNTAAFGFTNATTGATHAGNPTAVRAAARNGVIYKATRHANFAGS